MKKNVAYKKKACNRAGTVLYALENAVAIHGLLSSIRGDHGTENYDVHWYMLSHLKRGPEAVL